jgi:hypothetical protein
MFRVRLELSPALRVAISGALLQTAANPCSEVFDRLLRQQPLADSEHGEYNRARLGDGREYLQPDKRGLIFSLTREAILAGDIGALVRAPEYVGRAVFSRFRDVGFSSPDAATPAPGLSMSAGGGSLEVMG